MKKPTIYIASPYSAGDIAANVRRQHDCFNELRNLGFYPYAPLLHHYQEIIHPRSYADWMQFDLHWLSKCDAMIRLPGESIGADMEVLFARENKIPIFYSIKDLTTHFQPQTNTPINQSTNTPSHENLDYPF
jgi:hypothetical protein